MPWKQCTVRRHVRRLIVQCVSNYFCYQAAADSSFSCAVLMRVLTRRSAVEVGDMPLLAVGLRRLHDTCVVHVDVVSAVVAFDERIEVVVVFLETLWVIEPATPQHFMKLVFVHLGHALMIPIVATGGNSLHRYCVDNFAQITKFVIQQKRPPHLSPCRGRPSEY